MTFIGTSTARARTIRRRRAVAAIVCVFLGGASVGAAVGLTYPQSPRRQYEKVFDSIGLTAAQRRATDSIMTHYACALDSINRAVAPQVDSLRRAARQDVFEMLSTAQVSRLNHELASTDTWHTQHHADKHVCAPTADSATRGRSHFLRL